MWRVRLAGIFHANRVHETAEEYRRVAGSLVAAGTIPLLSVAVGLEVAGGFVLLLSEFLDQLLVIRRKREAKS